MATFEILTKLFCAGFAGPFETESTNILPLINIELEELDCDGRRSIEKRRRFTIRPVAVRCSSLSQEFTHKRVVSNEHSISARTRASDALHFRWFHWLLQDVGLIMLAIICLTLVQTLPFCPKPHRLRHEIIRIIYLRLSLSHIWLYFASPLYIDYTSHSCEPQFHTLQARQLYIFSSRY